jgi:hypothetical protein
VSASGGGALTAQALYLARIVPRVNKTLTTISLAVSAAGSGSSTGTFVGVYGSAGGAPLSTSLDCAASFTGSTGWKPINLQVAQPLTAGNLYFVAVLCNLSVTQVTLLRQLNTAVNNAPQASADVTKLRWAQQLAFSTTTMGSVTLSSNTTTSNSIVVLLS